MTPEKTTTRNPNKDDFSLTDLIDIGKLQQIQDAFSEINQIASTITDIDGIPITRPSNHSEICTMIRASRKGLKNCIKSGKVLGLKAARLMQPTHHKCLSCGFSDAAAPIIVNNRHIANWLIGQYHIRGVDVQRIREYSEEIGTDTEKMLQAFNAMPRISLERFEKILSFLWVMANEISQMGYQNLIERRQSDELREIKQQLENHQRKLEHKVTERTASLVELNRQLSQEIKDKTSIQEKQNRLITAIENIAEAVVITDPEGHIIYANPVFTKVTGYSVQEALGKNPRFLKSGYHDAEFYRQFWQTLLRGETWTGRFRNKKKDGTLYFEDTTVSSVKDSNGRIVNYVAVKRDVTKELEMESQLHQARKLESIGQLAAGIAHEINTPMQFIGSNMEFLDEASRKMSSFTKSIQEVMETSPPEITEKLRSALDEADWEYMLEEVPRAIKQSKSGILRVTSIVKAMKEFSHSSSKEKEHADLNSIIETTILISQNEWKYVSEITTDLAKGIPSVSCFADELGQVVLNLIVNAAHAIGERLSATPGNHKGEIHISTRASGSFVEMRIKDTGSGIPMEIRDKVFDPFFTTKEVGRGTGQGLAISYNVIVEKHGGTISFETVEDKGTTFIVRLPLS